LPEFDPIEPPTGREASIKLWLPVLGVLLGVAAIWLLLEDPLRRNVLTFMGVYLIPGGIDAGPIVGVSLLDLHPLAVTGIVAYFDVFLTLFWVWNLDHLARFSLIDRRVSKSRARAHELWERFPRLRFATGPGLMLFILLPIPTTGSFTGIAVGKLLELPDWVIYVASLTATSLRVLLIALSAEGVISLF